MKQGAIENDYEPEPWQVLVQDGAVTEVYGPEEPGTARLTAKFIAMMTGQPVAIYQVDAGLPKRPTVGTRVYPETMGWVEIGSES